MGRERVRPRLRRLPPPRRTRCGPARTAEGVPGRPRRVRRRVRARRPRRRRLAPHRNPVHQGRERGVHRAGRSLDHHDELRRGPDPEPCDRGLHGDGSDGILARARRRRPADGDRVALGVLRSRPRRARDARRRAVARPPGCSGRARVALLRSGGCGDVDGRDAAPRLHRGRGAGCRLGLAAYDRLVRRRGGDPGRVRRDRAEGGRAARPTRNPALRSARAGQPRGDDADRRLVRLPVHRDAVHAAAARLVAAPDRSRDLPRGVPRRRPCAEDRPARRCASASGG